MKIFPYLIAFLTFKMFGQDIPNKLDEKYVNENKQVDSVLQKVKKSYEIDGKTIIINDKITAIRVAEPILFKIYGKRKIISEKPYVLTFGRNQWIICGTLKKGYKGGTFEIIIDAINCKIIKVTHYK